ncbi:Tetrachloro-P-hydroquinone reductive dehalogenase [Nymphon striatum]|nr:Tetrachloro-P-hydroquinone reductive dehalogenase [Nymphon striatum]
MSSCSQRVRIVMAETGQTFDSHVVDLERGEHASEAYQAIHPKGVVPALVDDGKLIIESIDIIQHVAGDDSPLMKGASSEVLAKADAAQLDLKLLTFEFLFRGAPAKSDEVAQAFQRNHKNAWLTEFYRDFAAGFDRDRIKQAVIRTRDDFDFLDARLRDGRAFLAGDQMTLEDVAWMPNAHRFDLMGWPFERTPNLARWFERMQSRQSYKTGLVRLGTSRCHRYVQILHGRSAFMRARIFGAFFDTGYDRTHGYSALEN